MKMITTILASVILSSFAMAQGTAPAMSDTAAAPAAKMSKKEAKKACKAEGKKGKDLMTCVKEKTM